MSPWVQQQWRGGPRPPAPRARPHPAPWEEAGARHGPFGWQEGRGSPRWPQQHHAAGTRSWGPPVSPSHPTGARPPPGCGPGAAPLAWGQAGCPADPPCPKHLAAGTRCAGHSRGAVVVPHPRDMSPHWCCCWDTRSPGVWGQRCPACSPSEGTRAPRQRRLASGLGFQLASSEKSHPRAGLGLGLARGLPCLLSGGGCPKSASSLLVRAPTTANITLQSCGVPSRHTGPGWGLWSSPPG